MTEYDPNDQEIKMKRETHKRRIWKKIVGGLACIVIFCTTYAMILPAITAERRPTCGKTEHIHNESCYSKKLICGYEEGQEIVSYVPNPDYSEEPALICEKEEYTRADGSQAEPEPRLIKRITYHRHTPECYETVLICPLEEHVHTVECYCDPNADKETAANWEAALPDKLSGVWPEDAISVAVSQLGYRESERNFELDEDGETVRGYTRYGAWYGRPYEKWSAMFASFCLHYGGVPETEFPYASNCREWITELERLGLYFDKSEYTPRPGDLIFFSLSDDGGDRAGLVESADGSELCVIEGDANNKTARRNLKLNDVDIAGYGSVNAAWGKYARERGLSLYALTLQTLSAKADGAVVKVNGMLPKDAVVQAASVETPAGIDEKNVEVLFALDINIVLPDGSSYEPPEGALSVEISSPEIVANGCDIYYVPDVGTPEDMNAKAQNGSVCFDAPHFSTYVGIRSVPEEPTTIAEGDYVDSNGDPTGARWQYIENIDRTRVFRAYGNGEIPDYGRADQSPAFQYKKTTDRIVIDEGVTKVGQRAFYGGGDSAVSEIEFSSTVKSIGWECFFGCPLLESVEIPGEVEEIAGRAFGNCPNLSDVTLNEGLQRIYGDPFLSSGRGGALTIPASVSTIEGTIGAVLGMTDFATVVVADGNQKYMSEENIIYEKLPNNKRNLVSFPSSRTGEFTCPDDATAVASHAFAGSNLRKLTVPGTVRDVRQSAFRFSNIEEIYIADGAKGSGSWLFVAANNLTKVRLPDNFTSVGSNMFFVSRSIEKAQVPLGIQVSDGMFDGAISLHELVYNANQTNIRDPFWNTSVFGLTLIVGNKVDALPAEFNLFAKRAAGGEALFEPNNAFTAAPGAFADAPEPAKNLEGNIYADAAGLVYKYDDTGATLLFVPKRAPRVDPVTCEVSYTYIASATVPANISPAEGVSVPVVAVAKDALKYAGNLTEISFASPQNVSLNPYALANSPNLAKVNDATTVDAAEDLFKSPAGYNAFYNTGLGGAGSPAAFEEDMGGSGTLAVTAAGAPDMGVSAASSGHTMEWTPESAGAATGGYKLLTGDTITFTASVGNTAGANGENYVYRIYAQKTGDDCSISLTPGTTYTFDGREATCYATFDPNAVCLEFSPGAGETVSVPVAAVYPSPQSAGGGLTVWGEIKPKQNNIGGQNLNPTPPANARKIQASWRTDPDPFTLEKNGADVPATVASRIEEGIAVVRPAKELTWTANFNRARSETGAYGKDYASSVDFEDRITPPEDYFVWDDAVRLAIQNGRVSLRDGAFYVNEEKVFSVNKTAAMSGLRVTWDDDADGPVLCWSWRNLDKTTEIDAMNAIVALYPKAIKLKADAIFDETKNVKVNNNVSAKIHYTHSADENKTADADNDLVGGKGTLSINKESTEPTYFGESVTYTVSVYNNGALPWRGDEGKTYTVDDRTTDRLYISAENMERMFNEAGDTPLAIKIENASLAPYVEVTGTDGNSTSYRHSGNSDIGGPNTTVSITKNQNGYSVAVAGNNTPFENASLAEALKAAGFADTLQTRYTCSWDLGAGEAAVFGTGEQKVFKVYANAKDSFHSVTKDWPNEYPNENKTTLSNSAYIYAHEGNEKTSLDGKSVIRKVKREAIINKSVKKDGRDMSRAPSAENGDALDYKLAFDHFGKGEYRDLPLTDTITGSQYLLAPVSDNAALANDGLDVYTDADNAQYYKLKEGSYTNVKVGIDENGNVLTAASVAVEAIPDDDERNDQGLATTIKWYYKSLPGKRYRKTVEYKTLVDTSLTGGYAWALGNTVWMNDKPNQRIYDALWGAGTIIDFEKKIVKTKGATPANDVLYEDDYSVVGRGESVTYRIKLRNKGDYQYVLMGRDLADALPNTFNKFTWTKGADGNVELTATANEANAALEKIDEWTIGEAPAGVIGNDRQFIRWPDDAKITFPASGSAYFYFTLTFPDNTEAEATWSEYAAAAGGTLIDNTLLVYRFPSVVAHDLRETGKAALQKGVLSLSYNVSYNNNQIFPNSSRRYYNNRDSKNRFVSYYITVYNGGINRLYLSDIYDDLPAGFTYAYMNANLANPGSGNSNERTYTGDEGFVTLPAGVNLKSASVAARVGDGGDAPLRFTIGAGTGDNAIKYDERREAFYLDRNEAVVFAYLCEIGEAAETQDIASNVAGMLYTDNLKAGVVVPTANEFSCSANNPNGKCSDSNDGGRSVRQGGQAATAYGFPETDGEWLVSDVKLTRGGIIPGVTKFTESYIDANNQTVPYANSAPQNATVNWKIRLNNSGSLSATDYTVEDIMPAPYVFVGKVRAELYSADRLKLAERDYFEIVSISTNANDEEVVRIKVLEPASQQLNQEYDVVAGGAPLEIKPVNSQTATTEISFARDGGNLKLIARIADPKMSITEAGGYLDFFVSGKNPTTNYNNAVYVNKANFRPNAQPFEEVSKGGGVRDENENLVYVANAAPVTVAFGYATSSEKSVTEKDSSPANAAASTDPENNSILLSAADKTFTYDLTVNNNAEKATTKLVIIDVLPDIGDASPFDANAPRNSEFKVIFANPPNATVKIIDEDNNVTTLASSQYSVQYSKQTDFGGVQSADWRGEISGTNADWGAFSSDARSIRIIIDDPTGELIPARSKARASFDAAVSGTPNPGTTAWNGFGYHYGLKDITQELEAAPLPVGVRTPSAPKLKKQLVDLDGEPYAAEEETTFAFRVSDVSDPANAKDVTVAVPAGSSEATVVLDKAVMGDSWTWDGAKTYTIKEINVPENWAQGAWEGAATGADDEVAFVYDPAETPTFICVNIAQKWKLTLIKSEYKNNQKTLEGAVFALYSPDEGDKTTDEAYAALADPKPTRTISVTEGGETSARYLTSVKATGADGKIVWEDLARENYCLVETKPPDGYYLDPEPKLVSRGGAAVEIIAENAKGYVLPATGGAGAPIYASGGLMLMASAFAIQKLCAKRRRRKEAQT